MNGKTFDLEFEANIKQQQAMIALSDPIITEV